MPDLPNIKREVLEHVIKQSAQSDRGAVNLRTFCRTNDYEEHRVANAVNELGYALDWGVSPMGPWPAEKDVAREWFDKWGADLPDEFDNAEWY